MQAPTDTLWPWLVVAGMGALHGLNPASGWAIAAAWGLHARSRAQAWWALLPIALGHAASVALMAVAVVYGWSFDRTVLQLLAATLLVIVVALRLRRRKASPHRGTSDTAGLALGSFLMAGAHGAGLMLVPALVPLCLGTGPPVSEAATVRPLALALAAVSIHMAAMLLVTGIMAAGVCAGANRLTRLTGAAWKARRAAGAPRGVPLSSNLSKPETPDRHEHAATASEPASHPFQAST
ncbi:hypothetical protein J2W49_002358 [Hydrogenophaga palleronii]|uniref:Uncharacterized protein n=1 Tax=Hydrogenophaga palleronii TaxID=65655 RepID=A0ABU1WM91_9BURK|nr:hypothetical protein [Hydrogenophaga palleronii]MDR7150400.1 hypothetical protein [Hydrogenophaga palleronii]